MTGKLSSLPLHNNIVLNFNANGKELKEILKEHILLYIKEINKKIERLNNLLNSHKSTIDNLYMDKIKGLVDEEMYKRIYDKTNKEITRINMELEELNKKKEVNENQTLNSTNFKKCKNSVLDYMSLKTPTKDQIKRLVDRIEIDKDKKVYVYLKFPELLEEL